MKTFVGSSFAIGIWFALNALGVVHQHAAAQTVSDRVMIDVRLGAKVNVRGTPDVAPDNIVGKAVGGDFAVVTETAQQGGYTWYRVQDENAQFEGWIRGDLISLAEPLPIAPQAVDMPVQTVEAEVEPPTEAPLVTASPTRPAWVDSLLDHIAAVQSCVETGSAQPAVASDLELLQRGLIEVDVLDAANRQWKCVIRATGGTPLRFDPAYVSGANNRSKGVFFASATTGRPEQEACHQVEQVSTTGGQELAGWLIYTDCR